MKIIIQLDYRGNTYVIRPSDKFKADHHNIEMLVRHVTGSPVLHTGRRRGGQQEVQNYVKYEVTW